MKLKRKTFQYIESEVYDYHDTIKHIKMLEYEIMHSSEAPYQDLGKADQGKNSVRSITDETATIATALIEDKRLNRMRQKVNAIEKVYSRLIDEKKELIKLYYWERPGELTWDGVAKELNIGRRTAIRWRENFIREVAEELGER